MIWLDDATAAGNQTVDAGAGDDVIHGLTTLTDADVINGGAGADTLTIGVAEAGYAGTGIAFNGNLTNVETRSEEHTSELQSLMRISYAVFCLKKKIKTHTTN